MVTFNIICAIVFAIFWLVAMFKGQDFLNEPVWKKLTIAGVVVAFMAAWILIDHVLL